MIMAYFERRNCVQRNLDLTVYHNEKVLKASDQRDKRRHWPERFGRVKRTFCFTGAIDVLQDAVVKAPISA